jgi:hypothetical protein
VNIWPVNQKAAIRNRSLKNKIKQGLYGPKNSHLFSFSFLTLRKYLGKNSRMKIILKLFCCENTVDFEIGSYLTIHFIWNYIRHWKLLANFGHILSKL